MCSCKVFDTIDSSSIIISFKSDSASLICVFFWSDIGVILSPYSLGIAYQEKKQLQDKTIIAYKLRQMQAKKKVYFQQKIRVNANMCLVLNLSLIQTPS